MPSSVRTNRTSRGSAPVSSRTTCSITAASMSTSRAGSQCLWTSKVEPGRRGDVSAARRAYLAGLFRARGEGSLPDVLRAAEGFAALGDHAIVEQALAIAAPLAAGADPATRARLASLEREAP